MENKFADLALECKYKWVPLVDTCPAMDPILIIGTRPGSYSSDYRTRTLLFGSVSSSTHVETYVRTMYIVLSLFSQCGSWGPCLVEKLQ